MKKLTSISLAITIFICTVLSCSFSVFAEELTSIEKTQLGTTDTYYEYDFDTKTLTISGNGATPSYSSNGQGQPWYDWRDTEVQRVVIEEGITSLGSYFLYQIRATEISLPDSLKKIGSYSLSFTLGITDWDIPFGVTAIDTSAFRYCSTMKSINLPDTLKTIGTRAFEGCTQLTEITIPYSVSSLGSYAFFNCSMLETVKFQSLTSSVNMNTYCFMGCASLKSLSIPINATVGKCSFGYKNSTTKYSDTSLNVYADSSGYTYAISSNISYTLYDTFDAECAVGYSNTYTQENVDEGFTYKFTPSTSESYNFYSLGNCDVDAELKQGESVIAGNTDISEQDRNFFITANLIAGTEYTLTIKSVKSIGSYTLWIYPDEISGITTYGSAEITAEKGIKIIDEELLDGFVLSINFINGLNEKIYYQKGEFNGKSMQQVESDLTCGETYGYIQIGDIISPFSLTVNHNYEATKVDYTVDNDGYTNYKCILCSEEYQGDFVKSPAIKVTGKLVFSQDNDGNHPDNKPYAYISEITLNDNRKYSINENGEFEINSFSSFEADFKNENGKDIQISFNADGIEPYSFIDYGTIVVNAYDFNSDGKVNAKDYVIFKKHKKDTLPADYMQYFTNNLNRPASF